MLTAKPPGTEDTPKLICRTWSGEDWWAEVRYCLWHRFFCQNCRATDRAKEEHIAWLREECGLDSG